MKIIVSACLQSINSRGGSFAKRTVCIIFMRGKTRDLQKIDVGIALCHFMMGLEEQGKTAAVVVSDPGIHIPENVEYIASVQMR